MGLIGRNQLPQKQSTITSRNENKDDPRSIQRVTRALEIFFSVLSRIDNMLEVSSSDGSLVTRTRSSVKNATLSGSWIACVVSKWA